MFEWIITSSVLIAVILALRLVLKGKISLRLQYALWALVLVRLLLPVSIGSSSISIMNRVEDSKVFQDVTEPEYTAPVIVIPDQSTGGNTVPSVPNTGTPPVNPPEGGTSAGNTGNIGQGEQNTPTIPQTPTTPNVPSEPETPSAQETPPTQTDSSIDWLAVVRCVWIGGSVLLGAWFVLANLFFAVRVRKNTAVLQTACKLPVYVSAWVDTPCLFGFFRPAVYLTEDVAADERAMRHALEHELTHYRHWDHIWAILRCVCLAVHWYNPLVWWAAILSKHDAELACDESTIRRLGESERAEYGKTLLRLTCEKRTAIMTTATTMTGSAKTIKERIALIVRKPKMALYTLVAVLVIAAVAIVCTFTGAEDKEIENKLWPEDTVISCARFEYAGDDGYKLITSEISQFDSLQHMNLIPVEGEFTGEVIYRLVLNWNEIAKNETEYIILVGENCLSVNGQLYQPDGFDFSEILSYFEGKYRYFDYELMHDEKQDDSEGSGEIEISEEIAYVLNLLATLKAEDVTGYSANMQADTEIIVPLVNAAAATYAGEFDVVDEWEWSVDLHLAERSDDSGYSPKLIGFHIGISEGIVDVSCRLNPSTDPSDYVYIRLHSAELWDYIFSLYNPDGIDQHALSLYEDILAEHARWRIEEHRTYNVPEGFPELTGFEITSLRLVDSFHYGYSFRVYRFDIGYLTDDPDPGRYGWPQDAGPDEQGRICGYDWSIYFIAAHAHDDIVDYRFFSQSIAYDLPLNFRMDIVASFTGEQFYLDYQHAEDGNSIYTHNGISISIPYNFEHLVEAHTDIDTWCYGLLVNPTYYHNNPYMTDQTLFSLFHICEYSEDGSGLIFSIRRYTEEEYQTMYLNSYSRQQVFARDNDYYYCVFIPTGDHAHTPETEEKLNSYLDKILPNMIERNGWQAYDGENDQPSDEEIRARALIKNFATLTAEDIKYIPGFMGTNYSDVAVLLNDLAEYRIEPFESEASHWSMTIYLSGSEDNFSSKNDAWLSIYAYGEESLVQILYHSKFGVYTQIYFDYPALHQYLRKHFKTDGVIDEDALSHYRDIIEAKAEYTIEVRNSNFDTKFSGYEILAFHEVANFERDGMTYTVYEWDVGYITDRNNMNYPWTMNRVWVDSELRIRGYDSDPYLVIRSRNGREEYAFFPWDTPLYGYDEELELAYDEIAAYFVPETDTKSYTEVAPGITLSENLASLPNAVISYAVDYVQTMVKYYNDLGAYSSDSLYRIVEARITNIEQIPTGAVGLTDGINLYRLSYRLLADQPENIMLAGGMTMDGDWLTEWGSTGQPYLLMRVDWSGVEDVWTRICVTNTDVIMTDYGTAEMLERYDSPYLAASIELYHQYLQDNGGSTGNEYDITLPVTLPVLELSREEYNAACTAIMIDLKTGWWKGWAPLADCTYEAAAFECVWRETYEYTERLYGYAGYFRFDESGNCVEYCSSAAIVTLDATTKQAYNVWWPGDGAYHEADILSRFPDEIAEFVAEPNEERYRVIRGRLMELAAARMIPETPMDALNRLALMTAEDIKYISASIGTPGAAELVDTLGASLVNRVGGDDSIRTFWSIEFYLTGGDDGGYNSQTDEWVRLNAGLEENIVEIWYHERYSTTLQFFVNDEALYQLVRGSYATDGVIDQGAYARYSDFLNERAQETVDYSRETVNKFYPLPYTGYEILQFEKIDSFERDGARYEVYEWDVAFLIDDPTRAEWAGGMWLDSELRVRDRESDIYFVVRISGDVVEHDFFHWELYSNAESEEYLENARTTIVDFFKNRD